MKKPFIFLVFFFLAVGLAAAATITVTQPAANATWVKGQTYTILWTHGRDVPPNVRITLRNEDSTAELKVIADPAPNTGSYQWLVPNDIADGRYRIRVKTLTAEAFDDSDIFTIKILIAQRGFGLTAPNGGESWPLDSTRDITWNASNLQGMVRLDLYKGGTGLANKVGTITTNTPASTGKFTWTVGSYIGGKAAQGSGYLVGISSYTPEQKDTSDGPFTIAQAQLQPPLIPSKGLSLTYPRRADVLYKGTGYNITWTYFGLAEFPVRLDLLNNAGTTVVLTIAENMANDGQLLWDPPLSLPDADTFYKMRIRTMDGQYSDTVGPFTITKAKAPAQRLAKITVLAPVGPEQVSTGIIYPIRWKSTCSTAAEGPAHDGFDIHLMDSGGTQVVKTLLDSMSAVYDSGNPDGSHSWHWDWHIGQNEKAGTYRIAVTSLSGKCTGTGAPFHLVYPQEFENYIFTPSVENCWRMTSHINYSPINGDDLYNSPNCPGQAKVWFWFLHDEERDVYAKEVGRSILTPNNQYWYKDKGHLLSAKLTLERTKREKNTTNADIDDKCLGGVLVLISDQTCAELPDSFVGISRSVGTAFPVNASQDGVWEVDLSSAYLPRFQQNKPDYGVVLYPAREGYPCPWEKCIVKMGECYKVTMTFRFAKDITH